MCRCTLGNTAMPTSGPLWLLRSRPMSLIMHAGLTSACSSKLVKVVRISSFCLLGSTLVSVLVVFFRSFYLHVPATVAESSSEWLPALPFWFGSLSDVFIPYFISPHHPKYSTVPFMVRSLQSFGIYAGHAPYFCIISHAERTKASYNLIMIFIPIYLFFHILLSFKYAIGFPYSCPNILFIVGDLPK